MMKKDEKSLLPSGLSDTLLPHADLELQAGTLLLSSFRNYGYNLVNPPLLEFEETLLSGTGASNSEQTFRVMDPASHRMMGVRSDMTVQVGRIATSKLKNMPRPLRLMYAGDVMRVTGATMRPDRGFKQYGVELIGVDSASADAEVIVLSVEALKKAGVKNISVDVNIPSLPQLTADSLGIDYDTVAVMFEKRDVSAAQKLAGNASDVISSVLQCTGRADGVLQRLEKIDLNVLAKSLIKRVADVIDIVKMHVGDDVMLTIDACETRGFSFQTGIGFTLFSRDCRGELGRGGRYILESSDEPSVGFSIYSDGLRSVLPQAMNEEKIYVPFGADFSKVYDLRQAGKVVICGLEQEKDVHVSALHYKCTHILINNNMETL